MYGIQTMNAMVRIFSLIKEYFHSEKNEAFYCMMRIMETFIHHDIIIIRDGAKGGGSPQVIRYRQNTDLDRKKKIFE
jgi:hypothetical protein